MKPQLLQRYLLCMVCMLLNLFDSKAQELILTAGSYFVVNGNPSVVFNNAAFNNNGIFIADAGTVIFTGYADTGISYITGSSTTSLNNFTINKGAYGVAVKSVVDVTNTLTMATGNLYPNSNLTLKSTASNTARLAPVPEGCGIIGKTKVERYFPPQRSWRMITAPLTNAGTIYDNWQNGGSYIPGRGTYITGPRPSVTNGFDESPQNNYSMYVFNDLTQQFVGPVTTKVNVSQGNLGSADNTGYMFFVRGDRTPSNFTLASVNATTISALGTLQTGAQTFTANTISGKFTLIGNPYASSIDLTTLTRSNLVNRFYVWDPYINTVGSFVVFSASGNSYIKTPAGSKQTTIVQSGQAFLIQTNINGAASLTINESDKSTINKPSIFNSPAIQGIVANLYLLNDDSTTTLADGSLAQFDNSFTDSVTLEDVPKLGNMYEGLGFFKYGKTLSIQNDPAVVPADTLFLHLTQTTIRNYQLELIGQYITDPQLAAYLQDTYLNTSTSLNLKGSTKINFSVPSSASSTDRFRIVFSVAQPVAVTFTSVKATEINKGINVEWNVQHELNILHYEVEKSSDGNSFAKTADITAHDNNNGSLIYSWLDTKPTTGNNYYRIKSLDKDGIVQYSKVIKAAIENIRREGILIYPNPVSDNKLNIQFTDQPQGNYKIQVLSNDGGLVYANDIVVNNANMLQTLVLPPPLAIGNYKVEIINAEHKRTVQNINVQ